MTRVEARRDPYEMKRITGKAGLLDGDANATLKLDECRFLIGIALEVANRTSLNGTGSTVVGFAGVVHREPRSH